MSEKGFNLADVLKGVSNLGTEREQIEYIDIDRIDDDPNNFYELSGIEELAANIELIGLQQPVRVRPNPEAPDRVIIVSGHRRRAAVRLLVEEGKASFREIPCIRERGDASAAMQELRLIYANSDTRKMSSADQGKQAARVEELLYKLKEEGVEFPGRMRDHVAQACQMSKSKLARLKVIRENLIGPFCELYESGKLNESTAYALARQSADVQQMIYAHKHPDRKYWSEGFVESCVKDMAKADAWMCEDRECPHRNVIKANVIGVANYAYCACNNVTCCADCYKLESCKTSCPFLNGMKEQKKAEKKEAKAREREEQKKKDAPAIQTIADMWKRFGERRAEVGASVEECMKAMGNYYSRTDDERYERAESLKERFKPDSNLPFGNYLKLYEIRRFISICDLFNCSADYLLCRTDVPNLGTVSMPEGWLPLQWIDGRERPKGFGQKAVGKFRVEGKKKPFMAIVRWDGVRWSFPSGATIDDDCVGWFPIPDEEVCG